MKDHQKILILAAVGLEIAPLRKTWPLIERLNTRKPLKLEIRQSPLGPVYLGLTGMGPQQMQASLAQALERLQPRILVSIGLAGALQDELKIGDLIWADQFAEVTSLNPPQLRAIESIKAINPSRCPLENMPCLPAQLFIKKGTLVSSPAIIADAKTKTHLGKIPVVINCQNHFALGVDMETAALVETLKTDPHKPTCVISLRAISDRAGEDLPVDFSQFHTLAGKTQPLKALHYFATHPVAAYRLKRLIRNSRSAAKNLSDGLAHYLPEIQRQDKNLTSV